MNPLFDPADFLLPEGVTHVCAGGETACLRRHDASGAGREMAEHTRGTEHVLAGLLPGT